MSESSKVKRFVWILSLTFGPVAYFVVLANLFLKPPRIVNITAITADLSGFVETLASFWFAGFVFVWVMYWLSKFVVKYGPFV
jgi:hypothetical protein